MDRDSKNSGKNKKAMDLNALQKEKSTSSPSTTASAPFETPSSEAERKIWEQETLNLHNAAAAYIRDNPPRKIRPADPEKDQDAKD